MARPKIDSRAGSRVSAASSTTAIPIASAGPIPRYRPKVASSRLVRAAITVAAEKVIDWPTRLIAAITASAGVSPRRICSRTRNTRNRP